MPKGKTKPLIAARVGFELDNIQDKKAIKLEMRLNDEWLIIGYCEVRKIPKLRRAMNAMESRQCPCSMLKRVGYVAE